MSVHSGQLQCHLLICDHDVQDIRILIVGNSGALAAALVPEA